MTHPFVLPLRDCTELALTGGKAVGLARLLAAGFSVPPGICVTTESYRRSLEERSFSPNHHWQVVSRMEGLDRKAALAECQSVIQSLDLSPITTQCFEHMSRISQPLDGQWAVRSSATNEDTGHASFAGLYRTRLGIAPSDIETAIKDLWASMWEERVLQYILRSSKHADSPAMAVVIQPMLDALAAGVAYSIHPVTGRSNQVVVNAVPGLAGPLVDGKVTPDQYVVQMGDRGEPLKVIQRIIVEKSERLLATNEGLRVDAILPAERRQPSLRDEQALALGGLTKQVEQASGCPIDLEWAIDAQTLWVLQARAATGVVRATDLTNDECEWSRANFKETLPEIPSPLGLSFLERFMDGYIISRYRRLGCRIPEGLSTVRTLYGRPYLNLSLFHSLIGQLGGDPSLNTEQMGGEPLLEKPAFTRLGWSASLRASWLLSKEMRRVVKSGPLWFVEMKQLAALYRQDRIRNLSVEELATRLEELGRWLDRRESTFGIAAGVGQCLQAFSTFLPRWFGKDWRSLLNASLQGQGTVISAQQIIRMAELAHLARQDQALSHVLLTQASDLHALRHARPDSVFLAAFDRYLDDYGHRGVGESDVMSPRFCDQPDTLLDVIRTYLRRPDVPSKEILERQQATRVAALSTIRARCGWRLHRWAIFQWWYRRLCRFSVLREANRHHLMHYSTAARNLLLRLGDRLVERHVLAAREDIFFLTLEEREAVVAEPLQDWAALVRSRREDRQRWANLPVPDTIRDWHEAAPKSPEEAALQPGVPLRGIPISAGAARGPARLVRSTADWEKVQAGDIIIAPVIDPGMAPLFGLAAGIVVEMGGTLSHGAIIAREYGLPAIANVGRIMNLVEDGDCVSLDAGSGEVKKEVLR